MVRAAHKIVEDVVLLAQQFHLAPGHLHTAAVGVEADIPHVEALLPVALVTAHDAPDTGAQFRQMERLGQVIVGPELEPLDLVIERIPGRNDDHAGRFALPPELFEYPQAAAVGQHDVQQDTVVVVSGDLFERRCVIGRLLDHILFAAQRLHHDLPQGGFVFHDQDFHKQQIFFGAKIHHESERNLKPRRQCPSPNIRKNLVPAAPARTAQARKRAETVQVSALSVLSAGLSPAPDYFSAGSTWQAFEPSYAHFT